MKPETLFQVQGRPTVTFCNEQEDETGNEPSSTRSPEIQQEKFMLAQSCVSKCYWYSHRKKGGTVMVYREHAYQNTIPTYLHYMLTQPAHDMVHL